MKKSIVMTIGVALIRRVGEFFNIKSFKDVVRIFQAIIKSIVKEVNIVRESKPFNKLSFHLN